MIVNRLASSLGRKDEQPNVELAERIVISNDQNSIKELVDLLSHESRAIQHDAIKVLYEIGELQPSLINNYVDIFIDKLTSNSNRMVWGAMTALDLITNIKPGHINTNLNKVITAAEIGSVITKDHAVYILAKLSCLEHYKSDCYTLLLEQLLSCPANQLPTYAEKSIEAAKFNSPNQLERLLMKRFDELGKESQKKRINKVIKQLKIN